MEEIDTLAVQARNMRNGWSVSVTSSHGLMWVSDQSIPNRTFANGLKLDIERMIREAICAFCNQPAEYVDYIEGPDDAQFFCSYDCKAEAHQEWADMEAADES